MKNAILAIVIALPGFVLAVYLISKGKATTLKSYIIRGVLWYLVFINLGLAGYERSVPLTFIAVGGYVYLICKLVTFIVRAGWKDFNSDYAITEAPKGTQAAEPAPKPVRLKTNEEVVAQAIADGRVNTRPIYLISDELVSIDRADMRNRMLNLVNNPTSACPYRPNRVLYYPTDEVAPSMMEGLPAKRETPENEATANPADLIGVTVWDYKNKSYAYFAFAMGAVAICVISPDYNEMYPIIAGCEEAVAPRKLNEAEQQAMHKWLASEPYWSAYFSGPSRAAYCSSYAMYRYNTNDMAMDCGYSYAAKINDGQRAELRTLLCAWGYPDYMKVIPGAVIPSKISKAGYTECDLLAITEQGFISFETKDIGGTARGKITDDEWTMVTKQSAFSRRNPFLQNRGHTRALKALIQSSCLPIPGIDAARYFNIVVTAGRTELADGFADNLNELRQTIGADDATVFCHDDMSDKSKWEIVLKYKKVFTPDQVDEIYDYLMTKVFPIGEEYDRIMKDIIESQKI